MLTVLIGGIPFIFLSIYFQFRLVYAGIAIIDPALDRMGAFPAIAKSWRMTRRQNGPLSVVALYAIWALIRGTIFGYLIGLITRGLPEFVALFCGSYDVLADRLRAHEQSSHGSQ
jgi:membrane-anchored glycerophosphoryl diester phosphodiesterase (GDPDase)